MMAYSQGTDAEVTDYARSGVAVLPDPTQTGPFRPFSPVVSPGESWWWLWLPIVHGIFVIAVFQVSPGFYRDWILPEGYGFLEFGHFVVPLIGVIVGISLLFRQWVYSRPIVLWFTVIATLTCLYCSGEEVSWGQHFFGWETPEYWGEVNRQNETNLHNTWGIFEKTPRAIIEIGVMAGGVLIPLAAWLSPSILTSRLALFLPSTVLLPTAAMAVVFKIIDEFDRFGYSGVVIGRPAEGVESYLYFFMMAYLIVFARRIRQLEAE